MADITSNLELHYSCEPGTISGAVIADQSGHGRDGTLVNAPTSIVGPTGHALEFDQASDQYIATPYNCSALNPITISTRIKIPADFTTWSSVFGNERWNDGLGWDCNFYATDGNLYYQQGGNVRHISAGAGGIPADTWEVLTIVHNGSTAVMYVGNTVVATGTVLSTEASNNLLIAARHGNDGTGHGSSFTGALGDIRIYSRAFTADDVAALVAYTGAKRGAKVGGTTLSAGGIYLGSTPINKAMLGDVKVFG